MRVSSFWKRQHSHDRLLPALPGRRKSPLAGRIAILTLSNLSLQILAFIYRMMLLRLAGSETLGLQSLVMQVYSMLAAVCIAGMNVAVIASAARIGTDGNGTAIGSLTKAAILLFLLIFAAMALPLFVLRKSVAEKLIGDGGAALSIVLVMLCILLTGIENILKSVHIGTGHAGRTAVSELVEQSIRFLLVMLLLKKFCSGGSSLKVALIMAGMLGSEFVSVSFLSASYKKLFDPEQRSNGGGVAKAVSMLVPILVPAALTSAAGTVFSVCAELMLPSRLMLAGYTRSEALRSIGALHGAAMPLVMIPMAFIGALSVVSMPAVSSAYAAGDGRGVKRIASGCILAASAAFLLVNVPALPYLPKLSLKLFGIEPTGLCFALLTAKAGLVFLQIAVRAILNGMMKQRGVLVIALIGEAFQLALIIILSSVRTLHIYGYLIAACAGEGTELMIAAAYLKKQLKKPAVMPVPD